ncbi:MAG TPA: hypothetical protein VMG11_15970 [Steroidobacteraceae bacterium]|nr:hypothetical protein [Steroidobacteraceae bacterium]
MPRYSHAPRPSTERRSPLWPWLLMPAVALGIFWALYKVRHATEVGPVPGPNAEASTDSGP